MTSQNIPVVDLGDWNEGGAARQRFITTVGESLADIGFFAVRNHGVPDALMARAYDVAKQFFHLPTAAKHRYHHPEKKGHPLKMTCDPMIGLVVISLGPDGQFGTAADIAEPEQRD